MSDKENPIEKAIEEANREISVILKNHQLQIDTTITFPVYKILPAEVKLALEVLLNHQMKISMVLKPKETKTEKIVAST